MKAIRLLTLKFEEAWQEQSFQREYYFHSVRHLRIAYGMFFFLYGIFGVLDLHIIPIHASTFFVIRFLIVLPLFLVILLLTGTSWFAFRSQRLIALSYLVAGAGMIFITLKAPENVLYFNGMMLIFSAGYFLIRLQFRYASLVGWSLFFGFILFGLGCSTMNHMWVATLSIFFACANIIGSFGSYYNEKRERKLFLQQQQIITINTELSRARDAAIEANRAKGTFLANMSHDIRTPLNAIIGFSELGMHTEEPEKGTEYFQDINASSKLLLGLLDDILEYSRIEAHKIELESSVFDLKKLLDTIGASSTILLADRKVDLSFQIDQTVPRFIIGDRLRIMQILSNIIGNAVKFTSSGSITVTVTLEEGDEVGSPRLKLNVTDSGIGMDESQLSRLFLPFEQGGARITHSFGGSGLGMSIVKGLVDTMGGSIRADSRIGQGTTIEILLPIGIPDIEHTVGEQQSSIKASLGASVLVVEDQMINQKVITAQLESLGCTVTCASGAEEALELVHRGTGSFDLVLMDIQMPQVNGYEATVILLEQYRVLGKAVPPVIGLSAFASAQDKTRGFSCGMSGYLTKPVDLKELSDELSKHLTHDKQL